MCFHVYDCFSRLQRLYFVCFLLFASGVGFDSSRVRNIHHHRPQTYMSLARSFSLHCGSRQSANDTALATSVYTIPCAPFSVEICLLSFLRIFCGFQNPGFYGPSCCWWRRYPLLKYSLSATFNIEFVDNSFAMGFSPSLCLYLCSALPL